MTVLLGIVVGALLVRVLVMACRDMLRSPVLQRRNYRDRMVPTAGGLLAVFAVLGVEAGRLVLGAVGVGDGPGENLARTMVVLTCTGFALIGLFDDVLGDDRDRGVRGHTGALGSGRVTTGVVKFGAGAALALVVVSFSAVASSAAQYFCDAALVALAANLANLFDCAPGRCIKVGLLAWIPLAIAAGTDVVGVAIAPVVGAFAGLIGDDLHEHLMLGDTGAYALGGALGIAVVLECATTTRVIVLVVLLALTAASEFVSFGDVITKTPGLRQLDGLGRH